MISVIGLTWPRFVIKRTTLFGEGKVPITLIHLGPIVMVRFDMFTAEKFRDFLKANADLDAYLAESAPRVRLEAKRAVARARVQERESARGEVDYWKDSYKREFERAARLSGENLKMSYAIDVLSAQRAAKPGEKK